MVASLLILLWTPAYRSLVCLGFYGASSERVVRLPRRVAFSREHAVFKKIEREIRIFNSMHMVMPCKRGVSVAYIDYLGALYQNPKFLCGSADGAAKLLYVVAAANLYAVCRRRRGGMDGWGGGSMRKQLLKNIYHTFGRSAVKRRGVFRLKRGQVFYGARQSRYKLLGRKFLVGREFDVGSELVMRSFPSYVCYHGEADGARVMVKHYADKVLEAECYELFGLYSFTLFIGADKMRWNLSHTADSFFCTDSKGSTIGIYATGKVNFGSSICERGDGLSVYLSGQLCKVFVVRGKTKASAVALIMQIKRRGGRLCYLLDAGEARYLESVEQVFERAVRSRFVCGEAIKQKFEAALKFVPTLFLPTLVYRIECADDFFAVVDKFPIYRRIAESGQTFGAAGEVYGAGGVLNIVCIYSGLNENVRETLMAYADRDEMRTLIDAGVFFFFIDKISVDARALNYFCLMADAGESAVCVAKSGAVRGEVEVNQHTCNSYPVTRSVFVRNLCKKPQNTTICTAVDVGNAIDGVCFALPSVVHKRGANVHVVSLKSGRKSYYKLPFGAKVFTDRGELHEKAEVSCDRIYVRSDIHLLGNEEKVLKIVKNEGAISKAERRDAFLCSITGLCVRGNSELGRVFSLPVVAERDERFLEGVKTAIKNFDRDLFFALFSRRDKICEDVWAVLVEKVVGLRLGSVRGGAGKKAVGQVQIVPCVAITGDFELEFQHDGKPYHFSIKEKGGGFSVNYEGSEFKNFARIVM